jgi:ketosteroid isomerase-like protein
VNQKDIVNRYFKLIRDLRNGDEASVPRLMELWHHDGTFEFAGSPPVEGTFKGAVAIQALYQNRLRASGMGLRVETKKKPREVTLGVVDTEVTHTKVNGNRVIAAWRTTAGTEEGLGFDVSGAHVFVFEGDKIKNLRITVSPKPDESHLESLKFSDLTVNDVGRLSLAAWAVV